MTPIEKAQELITKFNKAGISSFKEAEIHSSKQCAIILCNEFIQWEISPQFAKSDKMKYWEEVKNEILKIN